MLKRHFLQFSVLASWGLSECFQPGEIIPNPASTLCKDNSLTEVATNGKWIQLSGMLNRCTETDHQSSSNDDIAGVGAILLEKFVESNGKAEIKMAYLAFLKKTFDYDRKFWVKLLKNPNLFKFNRNEGFLEALILAVMAVETPSILVKILTGPTVIDITGVKNPNEGSSGELPIVFKLVLQGLNFILQPESYQDYEKIFSSLLTTTLSKDRATLPPELNLLSSMVKYRKVILKGIWQVSYHDHSRIMKVYTSRARDMQIFKGELLEESKLDLISQHTLQIPEKYDDSDTLSKLLLYHMTHCNGVQTLKNGMEKLFLVSGKNLCKAYFSGSNRKMMAVIISYSEKVIPHYLEMRDFMLSKCLQLKEEWDIEELDTKEVPVIGDTLEKLRRNDLLDDREIEGIRTLQEIGQDSPLQMDLTSTKLDDPIHFATIFRTLGAANRELLTRNDHRYRTIIKSLSEHNPEIFQDTTRSTAFRELVFNVALHDCEFLTPLCDIKNESCSSLLEESLRDLFFERISWKFKIWERRMTALETCIRKQSTGEASKDDYLTLQSSMIRPNTGELLKIIKRFEKENDQAKAMSKATHWFPSSFFKEEKRPETFGLWFELEFVAGDYSRFKEALNAAPYEVVKLDSFMYVLWVTVHFIAVRTGKIDRLSGIISGNNMKNSQLETSKQPTFKDLCEKGRCIILKKEEEDPSSAPYFEKLKNIILNDQELLPEGENYNNESLLVKPDETKPVLSERFIYFLAKRFESQSSLPPELQKKFIINMIIYAKILSQNVKDSDNKNIRTNLHISATQMRTRVQKKTLADKDLRAKFLKLQQ